MDAIRLEFEVDESEFREATRARSKESSNWYRPLTTVGTIEAGIGFALLMGADRHSWLAPVLLIVCGLFVSTYPWLRYKPAEAAGWKAYAQRVGPVVWEFSRECVRFEAALITSRYSWYAFDRLGETARLFLLFRQDNPRLIPRAPSPAPPSRPSSETSPPKCSTVPRRRSRCSRWGERCVQSGHVAARQHYVSRFHLAQFTDPDSLGTKDPWLWQGFIHNARIGRRAPKNVATVSGMFDAPGGLANPEDTLEGFLAREVETPASEAMRDLCRRSPGSGFDLPPPLTRYLAWAAARSLPMQNLEHFWSMSGFARGGTTVEPPPDGLLEARERRRDIEMLHPTLGRRLFPASSDFERAEVDGWYPDMRERTNFLEAVHIQAYYFQARFFPRLSWSALHAPDGEFFVIADRAVAWVADGHLNAPPSFLRDHSAFVLAPISRKLVLVGRHSRESLRVTPGQVNAVISCLAHVWIVGPTRASVEVALAARAMG